MSLLAPSHSLTNASLQQVTADVNKFSNEVNNTNNSQAFTSNAAGIPDRPKFFTDQLARPENISKNEEQSSISLKRFYAGIMISPSDYIPGMDNPRTNPEVRRRDQESRDYLANNPKLANFINKLPAGVSFETYVNIAPSEFVQAPVDFVMQMRVEGFQKLAGYSLKKALTERLKNTRATGQGNQSLELSQALHNLIKLSPGIGTDLRVRISVSGGDIINALTDAKDNKDFTRTLLDNATIGLNYLKVMDVDSGWISKILPPSVIKKIPFIDGACAYIQVRLVPENAMKAEGGDNASNIYFVAGFESGDVFSFTPSLEMIGWNGKFVPSTDKMTILKTTGERAYVVDAFDKQFTLDPKFTPLIDGASGRDINSLIEKGEIKLIDDPQRSISESGLDALIASSPTLSAYSKVGDEFSKIIDSGEKISKGYNTGNSKIFGQGILEADRAAYKTVTTAWNAVGTNIYEAGDTLFNSEDGWIPSLAREVKDFIYDEATNIDKTLLTPVDTVERFFENLASETKDIVQTISDTDKKDISDAASSAWDSISDTYVSAGKSIVDGSFGEAVGDTIIEGANIFIAIGQATGQTIKFGVNTVNSTLDAVVETAVDGVMAVPEVTHKLAYLAGDAVKRLVTDKDHETSDIKVPSRPDLNSINDNQMEISTQETSISNASQPVSEKANSSKISTTTNNEAIITSRNNDNSYIIQRGDTLGEIAQDHGGFSTLDNIVKANPQITNPDMIFANDEIIIPNNTKDTKQSTIYTVQNGDTLSKIAERHGGFSNLNNIIRANPQISNPDKIIEGDEIIIPNHGQNHGWVFE